MQKIINIQEKAIRYRYRGCIKYAYRNLINNSITNRQNFKITKDVKVNNHYSITDILNFNLNKVKESSLFPEEVIAYCNSLNNSKIVILDKRNDVFEIKKPSDSDFVICPFYVSGQEINRFSGHFTTLIIHFQNNNKELYLFDSLHIFNASEIKLFTESKKALVLKQLNTLNLQ